MLRLRDVVVGGRRCSAFGVMHLSAELFLGWLGREMSAPLPPFRSWPSPNSFSGAPAARGCPAALQTLYFPESSLQDAFREPIHMSRRPRHERASPIARTAPGSPCERRRGRTATPSRGVAADTQTYSFPESARSGASRALVRPRRRARARKPGRAVHMEVVPLSLSGAWMGGIPRVAGGL